MDAPGARLHGVKALITDADSALSRAIAAAFARQGATVALLNSRAELPAPESSGIDVLVTNTAFEWQHDLPDENDVTTLERAFRTSLESAFQLSQRVADRMNDGGSIIITAPMRYAHPVEPVRALVASSHAIGNLTASLAQSLAKRRIRVNTIVPGPVRLPEVLARIPPQETARFGTETLRGEPARPEDVAPAYVFLAAAAESGFVNGATLEVTGGAPAPVPAMK